MKKELIKNMIETQTISINENLEYKNKNIKCSYTNAKIKLVKAKYKEFFEKSLKDLYDILFDLEKEKETITKDLDIKSTLLFSNILKKELKFYEEIETIEDKYFKG